MSSDSVIDDVDWVRQNVRHVPNSIYIKLWIIHEFMVVDSVAKEYSIDEKTRKAAPY